VPRAEIRKVMGPGLAELWTAVAVQGIATIGPWFTHHLKMPSDVFNFEIGLPVNAPVATAGRGKSRGFPAMRLVGTVYKGATKAWASRGVSFKRGSPPKD